MSDQELKTPDGKALPTEIWATYIPGRRPTTTKLHLKRGFALSALRNSTYGFGNNDKDAWYAAGHRLYVLRPGQPWEDVSTQFLKPLEDDDD